jgi:AraC-like DNA-binding protein
MLIITSRRPPHPALAACVDYIVAGQNHGDSSSILRFQYKDLPNANTRLIFKIGPQPSDVHLWVEGPRLKLEEISVQALELFAFMVKPGALKPLIGIPVSALGGQIIDLSLIWGKEAEILKEKIYLASPVEARIQILEEALIRRLRGFPSMDFFVQDVALLIEKQGGRGSLEPVFEKTGYTQRQVLRKFDDWMGMGPKHYARIVRCANVVENLQLGKDQNWTGLARTHGYFDQTHLAVDFKKLLGQLPSGFFGDFKDRASFMRGQTKRHVIVYSV